MNVLPLVQTGRVEIPMPGLADGLEGLISGFIHLIESTEHCREDWVFWVPGDTSEEPDNGLIERKESESQKDPKFFFHYRPNLINQLLENAVDISDHIPFLEKCDALYQSLRIQSENVMKELDLVLPGYNFHQNMLSLPEHLCYTLRLLKYKPGYRKMAKAHDDRSFGTLHVAESRPGLHFVDDQKLYEAKPDTALVFTGLKAYLHTEGVLPKHGHYVLNNENLDDRWSIVFFFHLPVQFSAGEIKKMIDYGSTRYEKALALTT